MGLCAILKYFLTIKKGAKRTRTLMDTILTVHR